MRRPRQRPLQGLGGPLLMARKPSDPARVRARYGGNGCNAQIATISLAARPDRHAARADRAGPPAESDLQCGDQFSAQHRLRRLPRPWRLGTEPDLGVRRGGGGIGARHGDRFGAHEGRKYRMLNLIDEFTHECLAIRVDRKLKSADVRRTVLSVHSAWRARTHPIRQRTGIPRQGRAGPDRSRRGSLGYKPPAPEVFIPALAARAASQPRPATLPALAEKPTMN
jgi:hypothetical protein